ncbi:MAG TPA: Trm112 family protein [Candidatus Dormibacteraeota bacterium]|nr:Trm112 family protein [Candidatus Dormibacteraeota bacterium]
MKRRLLDILACPIDKHYPLELHVFEEKEEITEGLLVCPECSRWYPISDEIPQMLPDDLREAKEDLEWLKKWRGRVPPSILSHGKPFRLEN